MQDHLQLIVLKMVNYMQVVQVQWQHFIDPRDMVLYLRLCWNILVKLFFILFFRFEICFYSQNRKKDRKKIDNKTGNQVEDTVFVQYHGDGERNYHNWEEFPIFMPDAYTQFEHIPLFGIYFFFYAFFCKCCEFAYSFFFLCVCILPTN